MTWQGFDWLVIGAIVAAMVLLRFLRPGLFVWAAGWTAAMYLFFRFGFETPIPGSVIQLYMAIALTSIVAYVASSKDRLRETVMPILRLILEPRLKLLLVAIVIALPALAAVNVYRSMNVPLEAPSFGRTVHPAPPTSITVHDNTIDLVRGTNPYRGLEQTDPQAFRSHVENGRRVYYENCFWCHGDGMAGDGMFAYGLNPIPTSFTDGGVLPNFTDTFFFWRIAKGGEGLPEEGGPWDSAMPTWEDFLSEEEIWDVILFLYDFNGFKPRALEEGHH